MEKLNLEIVRGDDIDIELTITVDDVAVDLTGGLMFLTIKQYGNQEDSAVFQHKQVSHTVPMNGQTTVSITKDDYENMPAGVYMYDIQMVLASGKVTTVMLGEINVLQDSTSSTS